MATLTYGAQTRTLDIRGVITLNDASATQISLTADDIISYSITESSGSEGLPLGTAEAASYALTISNIGKGYTPSQFDNAEVHMEVGLLGDDGKYAYSDFGVWYVCDVSAPEQSVSIDISGYDALATLFELTYTDNASAYPTTLGSLAATICAAAGVGLYASGFRNANIEIASMPEWGEEVTLRSIIGYISACAGGFARITRIGKLEIVSYADGADYTLDSDLYTTLTRTNGSRFTFNSLQVQNTDAESEETSYTRYAVDPDVDDNPTNTIRVEGNPLFSAGIAQSVKTLLTGVSASAASVNWGADPAVRIGDRIAITDLSGNILTLLVNSQSISFSGGMSATSDCMLPSLNTVNSGSYSSSGNIIDSNGNVRVTRIANFDKSVVNATVGHFEELSAASIKADKLLASIIDAVKLRAESISASDVTTDRLTAALASIIEASIGKLNAGTIITDELYSTIAEIIAIKVGSLTAESIKTDELAASLATFGTIVAGAAEFTRAQIKNLIASTLFVEDAIGEDVFIRNLRIAYAQMVTATIGTLVIKGSDGRYYQLDVVNDNLTYTDVSDSVTDSEIISGKTSEGRAIIETQMTVDDLTATTFRAIEVIASKINAAMIDVDKLFARDAFIDHLNTTDIRSNSYIQMMVGDATVWRVEIESSNADVLVDGSSTILSARVYQGAIDRTADTAAARFRWRRSGDDAAADDAWNRRHRGVKSASVAGGEVAYNAVYACDVLDALSAIARDGDVLTDSAGDTIMVLEEG